MNQLRQAILTIRQQLGKLGPTERLLIGSFVVILLMALFVVSQYSGRQSMVSLLPGVALADQQRAHGFLNANGIKAEMTGGNVTVGTEQRESALALLAANKQLPSDSGGFLKSLLASQSWSHTRQQNDQVYNATIKGELDRIISNMPGIKSASVIMDVPEPQGIGATVRKATASVAVTTETGARLSQNSVDAIAYLVGGAKAGLTPDRVRVIDGGLQRKPTSEDDMSSSMYMDHAAKVETATRERLLELLSHIPGVVIAVTAQVDVSRVVTHEERALPSGEGSVAIPKRETTSETEQIDGSKGAEPGVRSNTGTDPNRGGGRSSQSKAGEGQKEFDVHIGTHREERIDPKGNPTMLAVSVNVPQSYVVKMLNQGDPNAKPDDKSIAAAFEKTVKPQIKESIIPHVRAMTKQVGGVTDPKEIDQQVVVALIPVETVSAQGGSQEAGLLRGLLDHTSGSGGIVVLGMNLSQIIDKVVVGGLAVGAMGFMLMMLKKAGKKQVLPTAEELVGVPPALTRESDLIGEAEESQAALAGIELDDNEVRQSHIRTQVAEMVKSEPESAASLLKQWVVVEQ